jgi:hypothetical protein
MSRHLVEKGSITVDGVSLTVVDALDDGFTVAVIAHSAVTTSDRRVPGDPVNLEVDVMAKYAERLLAAQLDRSSGSAGGLPVMAEQFLTSFSRPVIGNDASVESALPAQRQPPLVTR